MNALTLCCAGIAVWAGALAPALAADIAAGKVRAGACAICHGPMGIATLPNAPNLAGQSSIYLAEQLRNYRSGKRKHEVMSLMAQTLSDQEIDNLAAWYGSLQIEIHEGK